MSMNVSIKAIACAVLVAGLTVIATLSKVPAAAQDVSMPEERSRRPKIGAPPWQPVLFEMVDEDRNGMISREEVVALHAKADADGDGAVNQKELLDFLGAVPARPTSPFGKGRSGGRGQGRPASETLFSQFDRNKDGKLTREETPVPVWQRLQAADKDKDGAVSKVEFAVTENVPANDAERPDTVHELADTFFKKIDRDKDAKVTKDEVPPQIWNRLLAADGDKDGIVTEAEFKAKARQLNASKEDQDKE